MKNLQKSVSVLLLLISFLASYSQGEIHGKVLDIDTKEPVRFATVYVSFGSNKIGTQTDFDGKFKIKPLNAGIYDLSISFAGQEAYKMQDIRVNKDKITFLNEIIVSSSISLGEFVVKEEKYSGKERLIKPEDPSVMTMLSTELKANPQAKNPLDMIATSVPGIVQADAGQPLYFRGSRSDAAQYIVDGMKSMNGSLGIPSVAIGEMSVYTGGIPAKYGDVTGGVVIIETKSYFDLYNSK